jgi:methionine synthase II (cobalamin-independent)
MSQMTGAAASVPPFRAEVIGSLLRPRNLKDAGRALGEGRLSPQAFEAQLDAEIARVIGRQEDIGLEVVTDGEFGRSSWFGFFFERLDGFRLAPSHFSFKVLTGARSSGQPAWRNGELCAGPRSRSTSSSGQTGMPGAPP